MSWEEVNRDLSSMEGVVKLMEEEEEEDTVEDGETEEHVVLKTDGEARSRFVRERRVQERERLPTPPLCEPPPPLCEPCLEAKWEERRESLLSLGIKQ